MVVLPSSLLPLPAGLVAVTGDEGTGKTRLLRRLGGDIAPAPGDPALPDGLWLDLALPGRDADTPAAVWRDLQARCPGWDGARCEELAQALGLTPHLDKQLFMLSTGSRRKVALAGLLAAGARVTCLDQPFAALDAGSVRVLLEVLAEAAGPAAAPAGRTWVVADYGADPRLHWQRIVSLDGGAGGTIPG
ncbi:MULTISPECIES: ATP-binding cassette domain-containing protein [Ramlibacter]|uniref:ATP-binding cassette domain-containing protein n=1 Tax=Ramlibacter aquaticus TaxID=2780094 RepID=A0ABR9SDD0_9BURK|nr:MULTISPECIES: ATP-binding cassette domain-containing protein [Ramlibacter]MBE7940361.1 ATP-binding cassette domain-containing protein [Ramlibacter aquaticus]